MIMNPINNLKIAEPSHYMVMTGNVKPRQLTVKLSEQSDNEDLYSEVLPSHY